MKALDLMKPLTAALRPETTLKEAVNLLRSAKRGEDGNGVKGLPVLDSSGKLVGMLSMHDILKAIHPSYLDMMDLGNFTWDGMVEQMAKKVADQKVEKAMTKTVFTVNEHDSLMECVDLMLKHCVARLPVVDVAGKVTGMIYEREIFFAVVKTMLDEK